MLGVRERSGSWGSAGYAEFDITRVRRSPAACEDLPEFSVRKCATLRITEDFAGQASAGDACAMTVFAATPQPRRAYDHSPREQVNRSTEFRRRSA